MKIYVWTVGQSDEEYCRLFYHLLLICFTQLCSSLHIDVIRGFAYCAHDLRFRLLQELH